MTTKEDVEKLKNDSNREAALIRAGVEFIHACTSGAFKTSEYDRKTIARRIGMDVSNFSRWVPTFTDELPHERLKADQVVGLAYGANSDEPARWLAAFCGGVFVKMRPADEIKHPDFSGLADTLQAHAEFVRVLSKIVQNLQGREQFTTELMENAFKVASECLGLAFYLRDTILEQGK